MKNLWMASLLAIGGILTTSSAQAAPEIVGLKLSLVIDISGSIDTNEYNLQMDGYKAAFLNATVQNNILSHANGIAVNVIFFASSAGGPLQAFTHLNSVASITNFANTLGSLARPGGLGSSTGIGNGMQLSLNTLQDNSAFVANRRIMDVSIDGQNNTGGGPQPVRNAAAADAITVNGLAIQQSSLQTYLQNNVVTNDGNVYFATSFNTFEQAVIAKIQAETSRDVPEPGSMAIFASMAVVGGISRLRRRNQNLMVA